MRRSVFFWAVLLAFNFFIAGSAMAAKHDIEPIGFAQVVEGDVVAVNETAEVITVCEGEKVRKMDWNMPVFMKDRLVTGDQSKAQFVFEDGTLLTLGKNSVIDLADYSYHFRSKKKNHLSFEMTTGTFRFVTGKITEKNREEFKMKSPLGVLGIRGTDGGSVVSDNTGQQTQNVSNVMGQVAQNPAAADSLAGDIMGLGRDLDAGNVTETHAHIAGSRRNPLEFTDISGVTTEIPVRTAITVTRDAGASEPSDIPSEIKDVLDQQAPSMDAGPMPPEYESSLGGGGVGGGGGSGGSSGGGGSSY